MENQSESEDAEVRDMKIWMTEEITETGEAGDGISTLSGDENSNCVENSNCGETVAKSSSGGLRGRPRRRGRTKTEKKQLEKQQREQRLAESAAAQKAKKASRPTSFLLRNAKLDEQGLFHFKPKR